MSWNKRLVQFAINGGAFGLLLFLTQFFLDREALNLKSILFQSVFFGAFMTLLFPYLFGKFAVSLGKNINPDLDLDEEIESLGPANLFRGKEAVGGKLFLTNEKLIFKSHKLNIRTGQTDIPYEAIRDIQERKTAKLIDNGLHIITIDGSEYNFVVDNRDTWIEKIQGKLNL
jgi:hypothetical protein